MLIMKYKKGKGKKVQIIVLLEKSFLVCIYKMKVYCCLSNNYFENSGHRKCFQL